MKRPGMRRRSHGFQADTFPKPRIACMRGTDWTWRVVAMSPQFRRLERWLRNKPTKLEAADFA
jgi:hypothetical protein